MTAYLRWSLRQLYLLYFWPTQFRREVEDFISGPPKLGIWERFVYLLKLLPWMLALSILMNLIAGKTCEALAIGYNWLGSWGGVAVGVVSSFAVSVVIGAAFGLTYGVICGVAVGLAGGLVIGSVIGLACGAVIGLALDLGGGAVFGVVSSLAVSVAFGAVVGVVAGITDGVTSGLVNGLAFILAFALSFWLTYFRLAAYPLDFCLSAAAYFVARRKPNRTERAWRWCPVAWNEVIWLPLPYVDKLLALLVRQDRAEGFRQIAFVVAERPLQRRVALAALREVVVSDLRAKSLAEMANITDKLNWTTDAPAELPPQLTAVLPLFERTSQHVGQYLALNSPYRKAEALKRAVAEAEVLQISLFAVPEQFGPRLSQIANDWRELLEAEQHTLRSQTEAKREIPNPFRFGNPVEETEQNVFTGRRDIARRIEESVFGAASAPTLLLHGPRRMGKTSLLNQLPRLLGPDFAPALVDCQNPAVRESLPAPLRYLTRGISDGLKRRRVAVEPLSLAALERDPFAVFDEWLDGAQQAMPPGMRVLLCLDEYERLDSTLAAGWGAGFLDALRHTLQHRPRIALMFTGSHTFAELGPVWTDRFLSARRVRVGRLTHDEVRPLLTEPIPEFDMTYAPGALETILDAANGQPFLTQAVAFELVQLLNEDSRKQATTGDVETAIARALDSGGEYFANFWSDAGADGQAILRALARREPAPDLPVARTWLREHDVLTDAATFAVPMVERWVREKAP